MATPKLEANGKTWGIMANYTDARGVKQRKYKGGFETKAKAQKWCVSYISEMKDKTLVLQDWKLQDVMDKLLYEKEHVENRAQSTIKFYEQNFKIIADEFGNFFPRQITAFHLQEFINKFIKTPRKGKAIGQCLSLIYSYMERLDLVDKNVYRKIKIPEYRSKETNHYDIETYKKLLQAILECDNCIYTPVLLMGSLGLRPSEALALTEEDLTENILRINKAAVTVKRPGEPERLVVGKTKTEKSERVFPLDPAFVDKIRSYKNKHELTTLPLCVTKTGEQMSYTVLKKNLHHIIVKNKLPPLSPYGLRHTFGQIQKALGTDVYTISRIMGHSSIAITTKTYFHDDRNLNESAIKKLTDII